MSFRWIAYALQHLLFGLLNDGLPIRLALYLLCVGQPLAYVVFDFKTGVFKVRTRTQTLAESEVGGFVGEVVSAAILCGFVERADMDNPKADAPATPTTASPLVNMLRDAFLRAANNKTAPAADKPTEAADAPEVVE